MMKNNGTTKKMGSSFLTRLKNAFKVNSGTLIALLVIYICGTIATSKFLTFSNQMSLLKATSTTAITALGLTFVLLLGGIDLSIGSTAALSGCLVALIAQKTVIPSIAAMPFIVVGIGILSGCFNAFLLNRLNMPPFIATMATMNTVRGIAYLATGGTCVNVIRTEDAWFEQIGTKMLFGNKVPITALYLFGFFIVLWIILNRTKFGRHVYAVGGNRVASEYSGINSKKVQLGCYVIASICAAFSGVVICARLAAGEPTISNDATFDSVISAAVGGLAMTGGAGTLAGTLFGAFIFQAIANIFNLCGINSHWQRVFNGLIIVVAVYINYQRKNIAKRKAAKKTAELEAQGE